MSEHTPKKSSLRGVRRTQAKPPSALPPIICPRCAGPIVPGQHVAPLFSAKLTKWSEHPVLSKPLVIRGIASTDGSLGRADMSLGDLLRQRAAVGGERERAELSEVQALLSKWLSAALVAEVRKEQQAARTQLTGDPDRSSA